jgi:hypothetical protein
MQREHRPGVLQTDINDGCDLLFERARRSQERLDVPSKYRSGSEGFLRSSPIMILAKPIEEVIWLIGQCADLPCGNIQQVAEARSGIRQAKPEIRSLVDENHTRRRSLPNQVKRHEGSAYPSTDDCDCRGWFFPCSHVSTLGQTLHRRNSKILMPYKQGPDIDTRVPRLYGIIFTIWTGLPLWIETRY